MDCGWDKLQLPAKPVLLFDETHSWRGTDARERSSGWLMGTFDILSANERLQSKSMWMSVLTGRAKNKPSSIKHSSTTMTNDMKFTCLFSFYLLYAHFYYWILMAHNSTVFRVTSQEKPQTLVELFLAVIQGTVELHLSSMLQNINVRGVSLMCCAVESSRSRPPWPAAPEPRLVFLQTGNTTGTHHTLYWTGNISTTLIIMLHNTTVSRNCRDVYNYLFSAWMLARCIHLLARCLWNEVLCWS